MIKSKQLLSKFVKRWECHTAFSSLGVFPNKSKKRFEIYPIETDGPYRPYQSNPVAVFDESVEDAICPLNLSDRKKAQDRLHRIIHGREADLYTVYTVEDRGNLYNVIKKTPPGNILFVDTETNGLPRDESLSFMAVDNWPIIHQIAWIVYTKNGDIVVERNYETSASGKLVTRNGINYVSKSVSPIYDILPVFINDLCESDVIVGHNIDFDINTILCELYRLGLDTRKLESIERFCTMKNSVEACGFNTRRGNRFPKLQELYMKLFHRPFENPHDAYCDIRATADCFWELFNGRYLNLLDYPSLIDNNRKNRIAWSYSDEAEKELADSTRETSFFRRTLTASGILLDELEVRLNGGLLSMEESDLVHSAIKDERTLCMRKPIELHKKAAMLGYSFSMFRIGQINYFDLEDYDEAATWYSYAIETEEKNNGFAHLDCYFECASACSMSSGDYHLLSEKYYSEWAEWCDCIVACNPLPIDHLLLYLDALGYGRYGQKTDLQKAITICKDALSYTRVYSKGDKKRIREKLDVFIALQE